MRGAPPWSCWGFLAVTVLLFPVSSVGPDWPRVDSPPRGEPVHVQDHAYYKWPAKLSAFFGVLVLLILLGELGVAWLVLHRAQGAAGGRILLALLLVHWAAVTPVALSLVGTRLGWEPPAPLDLGGRWIDLQLLWTMLAVVGVGLLYAGFAVRSPESAGPGVREVRRIVGYAAPATVAALGIAFLLEGENLRRLSPGDAWHLGLLGIPFALHFAAAFMALGRLRGTREPYRRRSLRFAGWAFAVPMALTTLLLPHAWICSYGSCGLADPFGFDDRDFQATVGSILLPLLGLAYVMLPPLTAAWGVLAGVIGGGRGGPFVTETTGTVPQE